MPQLLTLRLAYVTWLSGLLLFVVTVAHAQESGILVLPRLDAPIQLDGPSDEPAWEDVTPWLPTQYEPDNGAPPTERTEFLVAYDTDYIYFAHLARLRIGTALNTKVSTNAFIQFNSATNTVSANVRFRYNFREGNDLWIVYNEGINTDRHRIMPTLPLTDTRTILLKYTYTFQL